MRAWSKTDYYQIFQDNTRTEIPSSFVCDWFRSERMPPSIGSGMCIYWYPKRNQIQPFGTKFNPPVDRREKRNIFFLFFFPRISTGPIKGPGDFPIFPIISHYFLLFPIISRAISHYFFSAIGIRHRLGYQQIPIPETKEGNIRSLRNQSQTKEDGISVRAVVLILFNERN